MYPLKLTLTILSLAGALLYTACRKTDQPINRPAPPGNEEQFFTRHASNLPRVQSIVQFMQRENDTYHFVNNLVKKAGYARWDKTLLYRTPSPQVETITNDTTFVAFIPMVLEGGNTVNAQLVVNISPADTLYRVIGASEYTSFGFAQNADTSLNALKLFSLFATHERAVFNRTRFEILDNRILQGQSAIVIDTAKRYMVQLDTAAATFLEVMSAPEPELPHSSCITVFDMIEAGYSVVYNMVGTACVISSYSLPGGGGGGGTNGPAGGGGTVNPGPIGGGGTSGPIGWLPVGGGGTTPQTEPVDSVLSKYSRKFQHFGDSIYLNHSQPGNREYFFAGARSSAGDTLLLNVTTDNPPDSTGVRPNISVMPHKLLFIWHSHVSKSSNPADRRSFSPADIDYLRRPACLKPNFVSFADCNDKKYAMVITDVAKAQAFFAANNTTKIEDNYWTSGGGTMQEVDERCVKAVIGSTAANGISFYKSTDAPGFSTWTLLNP